MHDRDARAVVLSSDPERFREARRLAYDAARRAELDSQEAHALAVAVSEVCANVHRHAYRGRRDGRLDLDIAADTGHVRVTVTHDGVPFDPRRYVPPDLSKPADHGYGLYLVSRLVDAVRFRTEGGESHIELVKERRPAMAGAPPFGEGRP